MRLALAQLNPVVGDIEGNCRRLEKTLREVRDRADLVVFPELYLVGYPPRDLLGEPWFVKAAEDGVKIVAEISAEHSEIGILLGAPTVSRRASGLGLLNSALLFEAGRVVFTQHKSLLPTYDVFDEARYFDSASEVSVFRFKDTVLGISICEDAWNDPELWPRRVYPFDPIEQLAAQGAQVMINISASPFHMGKEQIRHQLIRNHAKKHQVPFVFVNQVGANDELVFDGRSMCCDGEGRLVSWLPAFEESVTVVDTKEPGTDREAPDLDSTESLYRALVLGVRDYLTKCGFSKAVIGLSGGIDSAVVCALAAAATGPENVLGIAMPSIYSADESTTLAEELARNLGTGFRIIPINPFYDAYVKALGPQLGVKPGEVNLTLENVQARVRGNILMSFSNQLGALVLSTGNKSELATGYCTLYGDMAGGLAVISDVPKTMVYELAHYINRDREVIPNGIITRAPSAELRPNQTDQDTLPPYDVLDKILHYYIEERLSAEQIVKRGFARETVNWVVRAVNHNEYKRRQAAPGLKVTSRAFGVGRRMPIAARYDHLDK